MKVESINFAEQGARPELFEMFRAVVAKRFEQFKASAAKRGHNDEFPYVPVVILTPADGGRGYTKNWTPGLAYKTREEAVERAQRSIMTEIAVNAHKMTLPRFRSLREEYGFARELNEVEGA